MKSLVLTVIIFLLIPIRGGFPAPTPTVDYGSLAPRKFVVLETLTIYHPVSAQCDGTPLITASNARIDLEKLRRSEIRWMALSRNLLKKWKGEFNYGDTVLLESGDPAIDGLWVINDNMNKRFKDRGDLLFDVQARKYGYWKNVRMAKWESKPMVSI